MTQSSLIQVNEIGTVSIKFTDMADDKNLIILKSNDITQYLSMYTHERRKCQ